MIMKMRSQMLKLITISIFSLTLSAYGRAPSTYLQLKSDLDRVSKSELSKTVNDFVKTSAPSRMVGKPGHENAKKFIVESVLKLDPKNSGKMSVISFEADIEEAKKFYQKDFDEKVVGKVEPSDPAFYKWQSFTKYMKDFAEKLKPVKGETIVWEKAGLNSKKLLVITAHYDTITMDTNSLTIKENEAMPGANYNASGVAVALALVKVLSQIDLNYSVRVVFLDWQGVGYLGSYHYAKELKDFSGELLGIMNLEMLGQDTSFLDKTKKSGNMSVYLRQNSAEERFVKKLIEHGSKMGTKVSFEIKANNFENSDTFRFWEAGHIAATFSQNWEDDFNPKFFQTALDTPETLNYDTLHGSYKFIGGAALGTLLDLTK